VISESSSLQSATVAGVFFFPDFATGGAAAVSASAGISVLAAGGGAGELVGALSGCCEGFGPPEQAAKAAAVRMTPVKAALAVAQGRMARIVVGSSGSGELGRSGLCFSLRVAENERFPEGRRW
jgi:hypothetical protein